jgi:beta-lactamase class A
MYMNKATKVLGLVGASCCVFGAGYAVGHRTPPSIQSLQDIDFSEVTSQYKFIDPLLFCQDQNIDTQGADSIGQTVSDYIDQQKSAGNISDAAFYFRDLNGGPRAIVNTNFRSIPSSLLKVPVAISAYEHAENHPGFLSTMIPYTKGSGTDVGEFFQPAERIKVGSSYSIDDLIHYMLADSDNEALFLLGSKLDPNELTDSYTHLGITTPTSGDRTQYTLDVKTYASFFRTLYNATYLSRTDSEKLLSVLSQSSFNQGLVAGIPGGIVAAHKFGEASSPDGTKQLHDCGIVYKPKQPYLICMMTKGTDFAALAATISHISAIVYNGLSN